MNNIFSGSGSFWEAKYNQFDVLIVDEAHRLKKKGAYMYLGNSQVEDIIKAARISVFFVDDLQLIRPDDEGTKSNILKAGKKYEADVVLVRLDAQFRCSGAQGYINWMEHTLQIRDTANFSGWDEGTFVVDILDDPFSLSEIIEVKQNQGYKARLLAGFSWTWTSEKEGNSDAQVADVVIEECGFERAWNSRSDQYSWAIDGEKADQIGCVHTSQGMEFDYVGVIIGNDLRYDPITGLIHASYEDYFDRAGKKGLKDDPDELTKLVKNIYRILLSRGMKGCYIYCRDSHLNQYLKNRLQSAKRDHTSYEVHYEDIYSAKVAEKHNTIELKPSP